MSPNRPTLLVITCSTRPNALGPMVADWFTSTTSAAARHLGVELRQVSLQDVDLPFLDEEDHPSSGRYVHEHTKRWSSLVASADGYIVVTPEYNHGMPASLKNALDFLSSEWAWKPMGFVSYGNTSAGTRSVHHAKQIITTLRLVPLSATIALHIRDAVQGDRLASDPRMDSTAEMMIGEAARLSRALAPMREALLPAAAAGPLPGSVIRSLDIGDAADIVVLQRCCWVDEAVANSALDLPPLHEDTEAVREWLGEWSVTGLKLDGRLIGMVRTKTEGTTGHIGRLAVAPDERGSGVGRWLLRHAEAALSPDCDRIELSTGAASTHNISLYRSEGYVVSEKTPTEGTVHLVKELISDDDAA